jgi:Protein of unknown function (DUF2442)
MDQFKHGVERATKRAEERLARDPRAVAAHYDRDQGHIVINLSTGMAVAFPPARAQGLAGGRPDDLSEIEITPSGYGLHWPKLDADLWLPALLVGVFGSRAWMAAQLGAHGGRARSAAKAAAARENGALGGRPKRKSARKTKATPATKRTKATKPARKSVYSKPATTKGSLGKAKFTQAARRMRLRLAASKPLHRGKVRA